jgi:hypothetical protein
MTDELFRKEAMEFAAQRLYGHVVVLPRFSHFAAAIFLFICIVLLIVSLLLGVNVEKRHVAGRVEWHDAGHISARLLLPQELGGALAPGDRLRLRVADVANIDASIPAEVESVGTEREFIPASADAPGLVYLPARLRVDAAGLRAAGLPLERSGAVAVGTDVVIGRKSWFRWLIERIGNDA